MAGGLISPSELVNIKPSETPLTPLIDGAEIARRMAVLERMFPHWTLSGANVVETAFVTQVMLQLARLSEPVAQQIVATWRVEVTTLGVPADLLQNTFVAFMNHLTAILPSHAFDRFINLTHTIVAELVPKLASTRKQRSLWQLFKAWDLNNNGAIEFDELTSVLDRSQDAPASPSISNSSLTLDRFFHWVLHDLVASISDDEGDFSAVIAVFMERISKLRASRSATSLPPQQATALRKSTDFGPVPPAGQPANPRHASSKLSFGGAAEGLPTQAAQKFPVSPTNVAPAEVTSFSHAIVRDSAADRIRARNARNPSTAASAAEALHDSWKSNSDAGAQFPPPALGIAPTTSPSSRLQRMAKEQDWLSAAEQRQSRLSLSPSRSGWGYTVPEPAVLDPSAQVPSAEERRRVSRVERVRRSRSRSAGPGATVDDGGASASASAQWGWTEEDKDRQELHRDEDWSSSRRKTHRELSDALLDLARGWGFRLAPQGSANGRNNLSGPSESTTNALGASTSSTFSASSAAWRSRSATATPRVPQGTDGTDGANARRAAANEATRSPQRWRSAATNGTSTDVNNTGINTQGDGAASASGELSNNASESGNASDRAGRALPEGYYGAESPRLRPLNQSGGIDSADEVLQPANPSLKGAAYWTVKAQSEPGSPRAEQPLSPEEIAQVEVRHALDGIKKADVQQLLDLGRQMVLPHHMVHTVLAPVGVLLRMLPSSVAALPEGYVWGVVTAKLEADADGFLAMLRDFDDSTITEDTMLQIRPFVSDTDFDASYVLPTSRLLAALCCWCKAVLRHCALRNGWDGFRRPCAKCGHMVAFGDESFHLHNCAG
eukprot:TRINITY_DN10913_c0_g1_i1.p1 TRINITY_DN10913_c0_g1~~TRINITY_DN10913_c0_g1_i1.p1  ORF type:complete len:855 (+),score=108.98 TRINITY_DN10913_c0_g1_i1:50-2566(+)